MSYILDALRKADAQRASNSALGIHAQPATPASSRQPRREVWISLAAAALVVATGAGVWWLVDDAAVTPARSSAPANAAPSPSTSTSPVVATAPAPAGMVLPAAPPVVTVTPGAVATRPTLAMPEARTPVPRVAARETMTSIPAPPAKAPLQSSAAPTGATAAAPAVAADVSNASARIYTLAELPADAQQAFPKLSISGGVYSDNVAQRMLIVNGQVFNEGSEIGPGVVLEAVRARTAVLKFRGLRISHPY